jgi:hypothetical protein
MKPARLLLALVACAACQKVPVTDISAGFSLADATWFEQEQTLFVFWRVQAEQGIGPDSQVEISYLTDVEQKDWTPVAQLTTVHTHVPVDCGVDGLCGSTSIHLTKVPRKVALRMRYHRDGEMTLDAQVNLNVVGSGPAYTSRSLIVYGVFDASNTQVQWRARHQFPTLRNEEVQELGLRRSLRVEDPGYSDFWPLPDDNPYGYAAASRCPANQTALGWGPVETMERAVFDPDVLPLEASTSADVCARSIVTDALGTFEAVAVARKNPEVRPAFPALRSPIRENTRIGFLLEPCNRTISEIHLEMQEQRLLLSNPITVCIDDWDSSSFGPNFASRLRAEIDRVRAAGKDMVVTVALHHDDRTGGLAALVEQVLEQELSLERDKSSPRVSGAFVFDSYGYTLTRPGLARLALWCPALVDEQAQPTASAHYCALQPDMPDLTVGPFKFSTLPILPTRSSYETFVEKYSEDEAGRMTELQFLAPERTPISENIDVGDYGVATFFNNETISAQPSDAFSFCASEDPDVAAMASAVVFLHPLSPDPMPISVLPEAQAQAPASTYALGIVWDFPFLLRLKYETSLAGAATAYSFSIPFGIASDTEAYYGTQLWEKGEFPLSDTLLQCVRFCDHPTFDSAGVYNVLAPFRTAYASQCYRPRFPTPADGGFPIDP